MFKVIWSGQVPIIMRGKRAPLEEHANKARTDISFDPEDRMEACP